MVTPAPERAELTTELQTRFAAIEELTEIAKVILLEPEVRTEVFDVMLQPRYLDRQASLSDLIDPRDDGAAKLKPARNAGSFRSAFFEVYAPEKYPALTNYIDAEPLSSRSGTDEELLLYCPYCEAYTEEQVAQGFTLTPNVATENVNESAGSQPLSSGEYVPVMTNDDYAAANPTIQITAGPQRLLMPVPTDGFEICGPTECCLYEEDDAGRVRLIRCYPNNTGGGGTGGGDPQERWEDCEGLDAVWTGKIQVTKQWDSWAGVTNTGGSEMILGRIGSDRMVVNNDGHVDATSFSAIARFYASRYMIRKKKVYEWDNEFDPNWGCEEAPHFFLHYEEDNVATTNIGVSYTLKQEVKIGPEDGIASATVGSGTTISYSVSIRSDDDPLWSQTYTRNEFFTGNNSSKGCGTQDGWARYSCYEGWLTLPEVYTN